MIFLFIRRSLLRFNTAPLGAVHSGGAGDLFPRIRKPLKNESSIPRCSAAGILYYLMSILRIADSLHIGKDRALQSLRDKSEFNSPISNREFELNQAILYGPIFKCERKEKKHVIIDLSSEINHSEIYIDFEKVLHKIQDELAMCWAVLAENYRYKYELSIHRVKSNILNKDVKIFSNKFVTKNVELNVNPDIMHLLIKPLYGESPFNWCA